MQLLTKEIAEQLPALYSDEGTPLEQKRIIIKFFDPTGSWTWYAAEASAVRKSDGEYVKLTECPEEEREDVIFFGLVDGDFREWGNFSLRELEAAVGMFGLGIERDINFGTPTFGEKGFV